MPTLATARAALADALKRKDRRATQRATLDLLAAEVFAAVVSTVDTTDF